MSTLHTLITTLTPHVLNVVASPNGLDVPVADVVIHDQSDRPLVTPGDLLLGIGISSPQHARELVSDLAHVGAAGVLLKGPLIDSSVVDAAEQSRVALLSVPAGASWTQIMSLVRVALSANQLGPEDVAVSEAPITDLFSLANTIADVLDAPITIEDRQSRVIAYSKRQDEADQSRVETILSRRVPEPILQRLRRGGVFHRLAAEDRVHFFDAGTAGEMGRAAIAIRAGDQVLGYIWAATPECLTPDKVRAMVDAAKVVALHLLRLQLDTEISFRMNVSSVAALLEGRPVAGEAARRLGLEDGCFRVYAATTRSDVGENSALAELFRTQLSFLGLSAGTAAIEGTTYSIVCTHTMNTTDRALSLGRTLAQHATDTSGVVPLIGIGQPVSQIADIPLSRRDADQALQVLQLYGVSQTVAEISEVRMQTLIMRLAALVTSEKDLMEGPLGILIVHDSAHNTEFVASLEAYLNALGDVALAANLVNVHPNTLRYRIRRAEEITGLDLKQSKEWLPVLLQLRLMALLPSMES